MYWKLCPAQLLSSRLCPSSFLEPSLSGYPVFGIRSPWVWLLVGGDCHGMAAPDMLFGKQCLHVPVCPVGCFAAETTPGIQMGPLHWQSMAAVRGQIGHKRQRNFPVKLL